MCSSDLILPIDDLVLHRVVDGQDLVDARPVEVAAVEAVPAAPAPVPTGLTQAELPPVAVGELVTDVALRYKVDFGDGSPLVRGDLPTDASPFSWTTFDEAGHLVVGMTHAHLPLAPPLWWVLREEASGLHPTVSLIGFGRPAFG